FLARFDRGGNLAQGEAVDAVHHDHIERLINGQRFRPREWLGLRHCPPCQHCHPARRKPDSSRHDAPSAGGKLAGPAWILPTAPEPFKTPTPRAIEGMLWSVAKFTRFPSLPSRTREEFDRVRQPSAVPSVCSDAEHIDRAIAVDGQQVPAVRAPQDAL